MNTTTTLSKWSWIQLNERWAARTVMLLLLSLALPAAVQAQFIYTTNNGTITITGYTGPGGAVTVPSLINGLLVTSIGDRAFANCTGMTSVTIPNGVTNIGQSAFSLCLSLTRVMIPNSVTSIGDSAFAWCTSLATVAIPDSVASIGGAAFEDCTSLTKVTIPDSVTYIGVWAFYNCTGLTSVRIGKGVTSIGDYTFYYCTSLSSITIPNSVNSIGYKALYNCTNLTNVTIADGVTSIGNSAFAWCTSLATVAIPNSVTNVGSSAFGYCTGLTSVTSRPSSLTIPNSASYIGSLAFQNCHSLTSVTIPDSVTTIGDSAFAWCTSLARVTIPDSVTTMASGVFWYCSSLTSVTIPRSVTSIGDWAFGYCTSMAGVYFQGNSPSLGGSSAFYNANNATVYYLPETTGWDTTYGGRPTALYWNPPAIQGSPLTQTAEAGSAVGLRVRGSGTLLCYLWYFNYTNLLLCSTNWELDLTNVQFSQSGAYRVVISNVLGAVTSAPTMLNVIAPVTRRPVPGVKIIGQPGTSWDVVCADSLSPAPNWTQLGSVSLSGPPQYYFDLTRPLPPHRFYRLRETADPLVLPVLDLRLVPAVTLAGSIGDKVRVDGINRLGPIDAWFTLGTATLTNTSQLYFDVSAPGQPQRLYRLVPLP